MLLHPHNTMDINYIQYLQHLSFVYISFEIKYMFNYQHDNFIDIITVYWFAHLEYI